MPNSQTNELVPFVSLSGNYKLKGRSIFFKGQKIAPILFSKDELYHWLLTHWATWKHIYSKNQIPDGDVFLLGKNQIVIIGNIAKTEEADNEDVLLCDFKRKQYIKLFSPLNMEVEYIYILNNWFRNPKYKDVLDYIISVNCKYYFNYLPLEKIGLPIPISSQAP